MSIETFFLGILREYRIDSIQNKFESEVLAAQQNLEVRFLNIKSIYSEIQVVTYCIHLSILLTLYRSFLAMKCL